VAGHVAGRRRAWCQDTSGADRLAVRP